MGAATENSIAIPQKVEHGITIWPNNYPPKLESYVIFS